MIYIFCGSKPYDEFPPPGGRPPLSASPLSSLSPPSPSVWFFAFAKKSEVLHIGELHQLHSLAYMHTECVLMGVPGLGCSLGI